MSFRTVLRRMVVGIVVKPWRLLWLVSVGAGAIWLMDRTWPAGVTSTVVRILIRVVAIAPIIPVLLSTVENEVRDHRGRSEDH